MNLLDGAGRPAEALALGRQAMKTVPNLALALEVARRLAEAGNADQSAWTLRDAGDAADPTVGNWELLREAGAFLVAHHRPAEGLELYRRLLDIEALPKGVRLAWLGEAREAALAAGETAQAADWDQEAREAAPAH
jgi:tetratricopeptide (TPR) repeat protein